MTTSTREVQRRITSRMTVRDLGHDTPCWISNRAKNGGGYTKLCIDYVFKDTHRAAYEAWVGPIPGDMVIDHLCRNRACCNPSHLEPVTHRTNLLRGDTTTAQNAAKTHCPEGHEYAGRNLIVLQNRRGGTQRRCRECARLRSNDWYWSHKPAEVTA